MKLAIVFVSFFAIDHILHKLTLCQPKPQEPCQEQE